MAATVVYDDIFGSAGISDAQMYHPGLVAIKRRIDFSKKSTEAGKFYSVLGLPKSFVAIGAAIESDADGKGNYPAATAFTLKVPDATASANDVVVGAQFTPSASAYKRETGLTPYTGSVSSSTATITGGPKVFEEGGIVGAVFGAQTTGVVEISVFGYVPFADGLGNVDTPDPRATIYAPADSGKDNVGTIDPYNGK